MACIDCYKRCKIDSVPPISHIPVILSGYVVLALGCFHITHRSGFEFYSVYKYARPEDFILL